MIRPRRVQVIYGFNEVDLTRSINAFLETLHTEAQADARFQIQMSSGTQDGESYTDYCALIDYPYVWEPHLQRQVNRP